MPTTNGVIGNAIDPQNVQQTTHAPNASARSLAGVRPDLGYQATTSQVDPTTETVEGRVESLLSKDNALMQRARAMSAGQMAGKGLVNSSMGAQAGTAAMMDQAIPIASQDAQTYSQRSMFNTDAVNQGGMFNAGEANKLVATQAQINHDAAMTDLRIAADAANTDKSIAAQQRLAEAQYAFQGAQNALDREQQSSILSQQQQFQGGQNAMDREQQRALLSQQLQFQGSENAMDRAQQLRTLSQQLQFQGDQNDRDRLQQLTVLDIQQAFQGSESELDRKNQRWLADFQITAQQANIPKAQVAEITLRLNDSIAQIASSPDMKPEAKSTQIKNAYDAANASIQTISTLYNVPLAGVGNVGTINPGGGSTNAPAQGAAGNTVNVPGVGNVNIPGRTVGATMQ